MSDIKSDTAKKGMKEVFEAVENIKCIIQKSLRFIEEFLSEPMCGKCLPCALGSYEAMVRLKRIAAGIAEQEDLDALERIADQMLGGSRCKKGKDTAKFLMDSLKTEAYKEHLESRCQEGECPSLITYEIIPDKCTMCNLCKEACKYNAIMGEKKVSYLSGYLPFEIRQKRCVKCDDCINVCPTDAIIIVEAKSRESVSV